jgi:hypothetical protein
MRALHALSNSRLVTKIGETHVKHKVTWADSYSMKSWWEYQ